MHDVALFLYCSASPKISRKHERERSSSSSDHSVTTKQKISKKIKHSSCSVSFESFTNTDSDFSDSSHVISNCSSNNMSHFGDYLEGVYVRDKVRADDKLYISPSSNFINLAVVVKDMSRAPINIDGIMIPEEKFVLVEGPPGVGKSTLCWELCRQCKTFESLQKYEIVLLLKLRERRVQNSTSLGDIFVHEDKELCQKVVTEVRKREGEGILLIMDGFDEMPPEVASDQDRFIMKLIDGTCLPRATRLVTSRSSSLYHKCFPQEYRHIEILGFTDESKVKFAESAFQSQPDVLDHFKDFIFSNPVIKSLMYLPVNCAIITQVYKDIQRMGQDIMPKTMTQLYTTLILVLIKRHLINIGRWDEDSGVPGDLKRLPEDIYTDLQRVSELAFKGLLKKDVQLVFTDDDDDVVVRSFHHLGLMDEVKEMYVCKGARTSYSFLHLSIQEFLAAWHVSIHPELSDMVCSHIIDDSRLYGGIHGIHPRFEMFVLFIFGIIGPIASKINFLLDVQKVIHTDIELSHCLYEAQNPEMMSMFTESSSKWIRMNSSSDLYVFGYILVHAPISWRVGMFTSLEMLASSLADHASSDHKISGSISELYLYKEFSEHSELRGLPSCVTKHMTTLSVELILNSSIPVFSQWLATLSDLDDVTLGYKEPCDDDYLLYQSLQSLTKLRKLDVNPFFRFSLRGAQELSKVIANSSTLDRVMLKYSRFRCLQVNKFELDSVVEAVLSSSTVTSLETNFPFLIPSKTKISDIKINMKYPHPLEMQRCRASLISLACYSGIIPLKFTTVYILQLSTLKDFITLLNNSLHSTTMIDGVRLRHFYIGTDSIRQSSSYRSSLFHALKRDVSVPLSSLRKSQSLNDLSTSRDCLDYYHSCPDLLEMQPLHNMHPKLHDGLRCDELYYDKQYGEGREIKLKNHYKVHQRYMFYFPGILSIILYN